MKVKITKASWSTYWYATHIGEVFEVENRADENYAVLNSDCGERIDKADCEPVDDKKLKLRYEIKQYFDLHIVIDKMVKDNVFFCMCASNANAAKIRDTLNAAEAESDDVERMKEAYELLQEALKYVPFQANPSTSDECPCLKCRITKLLNTIKEGGK